MQDSYSKVINKGVHNFYIPKHNYVIAQYNKRLRILETHCNEPVR